MALISIVECFLSYGLPPVLPHSPPGSLVALEVTPIWGLMRLGPWDSQLPCCCVTHLLSPTACPFIGAHGRLRGVWLVPDPLLCGLSAQQVEPAAVRSAFPECHLAGGLRAPHCGNTPHADR